MAITVVGALVAPLGSSATARVQVDSIDLSPATDSAPVNRCNEFTVTVIDDDVAAAGVDVDVRIDQADTDTAQDLEISFCTPGPGPLAPVAPSDLDDNAPSNDGITDFLAEPPVPPAGAEAAAVATTEPSGGAFVCTTGGAGRCTFGVVSDEAGTMNVRASAVIDGVSQIDTAVKTWVPSDVAAVDCEPETESNPEFAPSPPAPPATPNSHTFTCTALTAATGGAGVAGVQLWFDVTAGPNAEEVPFQICPGLTNASGNVDCTYTDAATPASTPGTDTIVGYFNLACPRAGVTACSNAPEPDEPQDEILKTFHGAARVIDCEPETGTNVTGTHHLITCTVTDRAGNPHPDTDVLFEETGPGRFSNGEQSFTDNTNAEGQATAEVTASREEEGDQTITGSLPTTGGVDECERAAGDPAGETPAAVAGVCTDDVTKTWVSTDERANSKITIKGRFRGRVKSPAPACRSGREVVLKKLRPGPNPTVGTDTTGNAGRWRIARPNATGRFYAKVKRNDLCRADRSRTVRRF